MSKAYAYVRYSSTVQGEGDTVERQLTPLEAFTKETNIQITETFIDEGVSSFRGNNARVGKLKVVLDRIKNGELRRGDYLVVESIDRITRQRVFDGVELLQSILKSGVRIYTTFDKKTYSHDDPSRDLETLVMIAVIAKRANEESEIKSDRRKKNWQAAKRLAVEEGKVFNKSNPPYGLRYCEETQKFVLDEKESTEIRQIFSLLKVTGVSGAVRIINRTSERKWTNKAINVLLRSKYPLGMLMSQKRGDGQKKVFIEFIEGYYPAIITHTEYNEAVAAMQARKTRKEYGNSTIGNLNVFRHVVKCGKCGESFVFETQKNPKGELYYYFHCKTRKEHKGDCDQRFRYDLAFGMLLSTVAIFNPAKKPMKEFKTIKIPKEIERLMRKDFDRRMQSIPDRPKREYLCFTIKETAEQRLQKVRMKKFGENLFSMLGNHGGATSKVEKEFEDEKEKLAKLQMMLSNLEASMDASFDENAGRIPRALRTKLYSLESEIDNQIKIVNELGVRHSEMSTTIPIASPKELIEKFKTEAGRLELNGFFKSQKVVFSFSFDPEVRKLHMAVYQENDLVWDAHNFFALHNPLASYGIDKLADILSPVS